MTNHLHEAGAAGNPQDPAGTAPAVMTPNSDATPQFGGEVSAMGPRQDMFALDVLAGGPAQDRTGPPATFTGGDLGKGLGGSALGLEPGKPEAPGYEVGQAIGI